ncbi:HAMP domain-containing histidine kinase [Catenovulum sp. SM1970]|uniref:sensor histidine kinase n=1 Tax=Marinifaba aquimaris TaxID=2741323 RepID=UPI001574115D|nr:HAMP domain-containing sensor histidine kinase [Marinifaba aquimaris]NTS77629.1 HAMP domain-containing histidine kinase [Marinifaba aquimaris]
MKNSLCMLIQSIDTLSTQSAEQDKEQSEELARLHYEASRLNTNLLQLLSLYRAEKNQLPLNVEEHYIEDLIDEVLAKNELYIENHQLSVEADFDSELVWYFDMDMISNLLNDIFINALRYSKGKIHVKAELEAEQLKISIADNGEGYPESMLAISEVEMHDLDLNAGRTGLGLFFARLIAQAHQNKNKQGKILLQNGGSLGGSVFTLYLP